MSADINELQKQMTDVLRSIRQAGLDEQDFIDSAIWSLEEES